MEKLEISNLDSKVSLIQRVLLDTPTQNEMMLLTHIYVTLRNLFVSNLRGYCYQI